MNILQNVHSCHSSADSKAFKFNSKMFRVDSRILCLAVIVIVNIGQCYGQSHDLILGTYDSTRSEQISTQTVHKDNSGWFSSWKKVEANLKFPNVSGCCVLRN